MPHTIALQMDALNQLNWAGDSTLYLASAALGRGHKLFHYEPRNLSLSLNQGHIKVEASGHDLFWRDGQWQLHNKRTVDLNQFDIVLMRQDPPFDLAYITATHILDHIKDKVRVINDPAGVRNAPEKLLLTYFPELTPPTLFTRDEDAVRAFRHEMGEIVIKPIYSYGGRGVFRIKPDDDNLPSLIEMLTSQSREPWIVQKFLPVHELGDKRILVFDGKPVGAFRRTPAKGDIRGNMRVGGTVEAVPISARDQAICERLSPVLQEGGLRLVGLDVIGDYLTEINVTSPTGLVTYDKLTHATAGQTLANKFWDMVEAR